MMRTDMSVVTRHCFRLVGATKESKVARPFLTTTTIYSWSEREIDTLFRISLTLRVQNHLHIPSFLFS